MNLCTGCGMSLRGYDRTFQVGLSFQTKVQFDRFPRLGKLLDRLRLITIRFDVQPAHFRIVDRDFIPAILSKKYLSRPKLSGTSTLRFEYTPEIE
jgi:hypothetical protein